MNQCHNVNPSFIEPNSKSKTDSKPFFSIGLTTYNRPELLKQTLSSIMKQTFSDFEVLVGNDYVQEPLCAELLGIRDQRIRFVNHSPRLGEGRNMNALLKMGRGRYFTWQCDDDLYAPNFLEDVYSALVKFKFPLCIFTSYEFIYGTSFHNVENTLSGQAQIFSGRQFTRKYWSGRLKAIGCTGVYRNEYLQELGGVQFLVDIHNPLYSEYLLLVQVGLQEHVAHIDKPLILYRIHEDAWGCITNDLLLYKQAGENLLQKSITVFKNHKLRNDFCQNIAYILYFIVTDYFNKARSHDALLSRLKVVPFFFSLKKQFKSLKGTDLYWKAMLSWGWIGVRLFWILGTRFNLKAALFPILLKFVRTFLSLFGRHRYEP